MNFDRMKCSVFLVFSLISLSGLGTQAKAATLTEPWAFVDINRDFCQLTASYGDIGLKFARARNSSGPIRVHVQGDIPQLAVKGYTGSISFDGKHSTMAEAADYSTSTFGFRLYRWDFADPSILTYVRDHNELTLKIGTQSIGPFSLAGSKTPVNQFIACTGLNSDELVSKKPRYSLTQENLKLLERALWTDSRGWAFNRYVANSIFNTDILEASSEKNYTVRAYYKYNRTQTGFVDVEMVDGRVNCMRYHDQPFNCKIVYVR